MLVPGARPRRLFLQRFEGDVRQWQGSLPAPLKPSGPGCFGVAAPTFWHGPRLCRLFMASVAPQDMLLPSRGLQDMLLAIVCAELDGGRLWRDQPVWWLQSAGLVFDRAGGHRLGCSYAFMASVAQQDMLLAIAWAMPGAGLWPSPGRGLRACFSMGLHMRRWRLAAGVWHPFALRIRWGRLWPNNVS